MRRVMIIGGPGFGISTLAQEIGRHLLTGETEIDGFLARIGTG
jgi:adenylate kinase family enzyme